MVANAIVALHMLLFGTLNLLLTFAWPLLPLFGYFFMTWTTWMVPLDLQSLRHGNHSLQVTLYVGPNVFLQVQL